MLGLFALISLASWTAQAAPIVVRTELPVAIIPAAETNRGDRLANVLVLHFTGCSLREAFDHFQYGHVSAHYTVDRTGDIYQHVDEHEAAHHAGLSYWRRESVNQSSIGIEIVNAGSVPACGDGSPGPEGFQCSGGYAWEIFAEAQIQRVIALCQDILQRNAIDPFDVVGHADVAPTRRQDPGPAFPWLRLAQAGIGVAYDASGFQLVHGEQSFPLRAVGRAPVAEIQARLAAIGYAVPSTGNKDIVTSRVLTAFNSHYLAQFDDRITDETLAVLDGLWRWRQERQTARLTSEEAYRLLADADLALGR